MTRDGGDDTSRVLGAPRLMADVVERVRLTRRLDARAPLTVIRGPGGSGKTVLTADWVRRAGVTGAWVTVDSSTSTRERLWTAVAERLAGTGPASAGSGGFLDSVGAVGDLRALLRRSLGMLRSPRYLVLDNFHALRDADAVAEDLVDLLLTSAQLNAIVLTRAPTLLERSVTAARLDRVLLTTVDLRLTQQETAAVLASAGLRPPDAVADLHRASGGSPLLVRALARGLGTGVGPDDSPEAVTRAVVADLLRGISAPLREFMMRTAVPEMFDAELACRLAGCVDATPYIDAVKAQGMIMRVDCAGRPLYRYPPMLREALLEEAEEQIGPELVELHLLTAEWAEDHVSAKTALEHALAARELGLVSQILLRHGTDLVAERDVYSMLAHLSVETVAGHPVIALFLGIGARLRQARTRAEEYLAAATTAARVLGQHAKPAEKAALATVESVALRLTGRPAQAVPAARRALRLLAGSAAATGKLSGQVGHLRLQNALTLWRAGLPDEVRAALSENVAELDTVPITAALATISTGAAIRAIEGDLPSARRALARVDDGDWPAAVRDDYPGAAYHLAKAVLALEVLDLAEVRRYTEPRPPHVDSIDVQPYMVAVEMLVDLAEGRRAQVLQRLHRYLRAEDRCDLSQPDRRVLVPVLALLDLARGQAGQAEQLLATLSPTSPVVLVLRALAAHLTEDHDAVVGLLTRLETTDTTPRIDAVAHLVMAASSLRAGKPELAVVALEKMAAIMADCGLRAHLALVPRADLLALRELAEERELGVAAWLDAEGVPDVMPERASTVALTERERVVLQALVEGGSHTEIAQRLFVSPNTVKSQLRSLYRKLDVTRREEVLSAAYAQGLLEHTAALKSVM